MRGYILKKTAELIEQIEFNADKLEITIEIKGDC